MLTPARPSARAISATCPACWSRRAAAPQRSRRPARPRAGGGGPRGRRRARRRPRRGRRRGSARRPRRGARATASIDRRRPRDCSRRCRPRSPGWRRRPGSCRGSSGRPRAGARSPRLELRRRLCDEDVGDHVRQVADRRHQPVVGVGVDRLRAGAEVGDGALQAVVEDAARALGRGQVPAGALEEVGAGVLDSGGLGPGQRVAADEALVGRRAPRPARPWSSRRR